MLLVNEADQTSVYLKKEHWLEKALLALSKSGGQKPRIESLVAEIGVSRGSFYWHFKDRAEFIRELVDYWHRESTLVVVSRLDEKGASAQEKLRMLMEMVCVQKLTRHDQAVRNWALGEQGVEEQVMRTDEFRCAYVKKLFKDCGFSDQDAKFRATIFVSEASREGLLFNAMNEKERRKRARMFYELLMTNTGK